MWLTRAFNIFKFYGSASTPFELLQANDVTSEPSIL
jgi:hypothetical protein